MKKQLILLMVLSNVVWSADNEISIDQSGATLNADIEQLGSGNLIGGASAVAGTMTPLDLDGTSMTLDINQIGSSNLFKGDINADNYIGFFEFSGSSNIFDIQTDPTNTYSTDGSNVNISVTGTANDMSLDQGTAAIATTLDLDWIINGSNNTIDSDIDVDLATNYMNVDGSDNTINYNGDGYQGGHFHLNHTGGSRAINVTQASTLDNDWLRVISNGSNGTFCIIQNDQGTATSCP
jgi:hypothetical protein|tara:strand:- start:1718 stop:2428 length:711 start_codon:yes stop_codon:yes gene_type:complete